MNEYVGIDIGGTKIEAVLVDERNTVLNTCRIPARPGAQNVLDDVIGITRRLGGEPVAVGVGLPGQVDSVTGVVRDIVNLDIWSWAARPARRWGSRCRLKTMSMRPRWVPWP